MAERLLVQFMHPGDEPGFGEGLAWNQGPHRRKFLRCPGTWLDGEVPREGPMMFWGEWEPESRAQRVSQPLPDGPRQVFSPYYVRPATFVRHQNTDPFVFGPRFLYSNCQQRRRTGPTVLQRLDRGSIILFGSHRRGRFTLDTVLVVADRTPLTPSTSGRLEVPQAFLDVTVGPLFERQAAAQEVERRARGMCVTVTGATYVLYRGATFEDPVDGLYSFTPCQPSAESPRGFARPTIAGSYISSTLTQSFRTQSLEAPDARAVWNDVRRQVSEHGCAIGVRAAVPPLNAPLPA